MNKINDGGPAFPAPDVIDHDRNYYAPGGPGMTLRDYFAAKALPELIRENSDIDCDDFPAVTRGVAFDAYQYADALLAAREARP